MPKTFRRRERACASQAFLFAAVMIIRNKSPGEQVGLE
jgi:hypothetical protein